MKIAFLADPLDRQYGGIHVFTRELLNGLSMLGSKHEYIVIRSEEGNKIEGMEEVVVPYSSFPGYRFWRLFVQLPRLLRKMNVDVVVEMAHFGPFNLPTQIKRVTVIHDMTVFIYPEKHEFLSQFLQRKLLSGILKRSDYIITNSDNTTKDAVRYFPFLKSKISSVYLGKDTSFKLTTNHEVLESYGISTPYILCVGTLEPRKNIVLLIKAFNIFKKKTGLPHSLVLIGKKGWKTEGIFDAINRSSFREEIHWIGYVKKEELPVMYSMSVVFAYPSLYEGFGLPILEAMACETPVITSRVSSLPEVGGSAVMYIESDSEDDLSGHLEIICTDAELRKKYSQLGLSRADQFNWALTAQGYEHLFDKLS